jgi:phosphopantetheinyl transferase
MTNKRMQFRTCTNKLPNARALITDAIPLRKERRSSSRPHFTEGWRKVIHAGPARFSQSKTNRKPNTIQVWIASSDAVLRADSCLRLLTGDDWRSLDRIRTPLDRDSAVASRILLRLGLSKAADRQIQPIDWEFSRHGQDRPRVADGLPQIHYSVSHTEQMVAVAISSDVNVGVDVESVDRELSDTVMAAFRHRQEDASTKTLPDTQNIREFIRLWTLKEAYTKMLGVGHELDFKTLNFTLDPTTLASVHDPAAGSPAHFESIYMSAGHALFHVSLAMERPPDFDGDTEVQMISLV